MIDGRRDVTGLLAIAFLALVFMLGARSQDDDRTFVVNLKEPHPVRGEVEVRSPIPHGDLVRILDITIGSSSAEETALWVDAGTLDVSGFTSIVLSLYGDLKGIPSTPGVVAVVLVPDEEEILRAFAQGEVHLSLEATAEAGGSDLLYFSGTAERLPIGFPQYRVFLYNTTDRSAAANIFAYLTN